MLLNSYKGLNLLDLTKLCAGLRSGAVVVPMRPSWLDCDKTLFPAPYRRDFRPIKLPFTSQAALPSRDTKGAAWSGPSRLCEG